METNIELTNADEVRAEKISTYLWLTFGICITSNIFAGLISTLMSVYLPVVVNTLTGTVDNDQLNHVSAYINALYVLGWAVGGFTWGIISDKTGRAMSLVLSVAVYGIATFFIGLATTWEMVVMLRMLSGFAVGGVLVITPTILSEVWPQKSRAIILGIDSIGFPIGIFSSGLVTYLVSDWHQAFFVGIIPTILAAISIRALQESDRSRSELQKTSAERSKLTPEDKNNLLRGSIIFSSMLIGLWALFSWIPTWVQSILVSSSGQTERGVTMMLLGAGGLTGGFFSGWISNTFGVRKAMMFCFAGCSVVSFLMFGMNEAFSKLVYGETVLLSLFFGISQGLLSIYIPQLFPSSIRATATGFCFNIGRFATAAAVFFIGALVTTLGGYSHALLTFSTVFIAGFITVFFTKDNSIIKQ